MFENVVHRSISWGECDPAGIVFYPRFFEMFDDATAALLEAASGMTRAELIRHHDVLGWPMVKTSAEFRAPASYDDRVSIHTAVKRIGRSSFDIEHLLKRDATICVIGRETRVWARHGPATKPVEAIPMPADLRARLEA